MDKHVAENELVGAVITAVDSYGCDIHVSAEKDGRKFRLDAVEEWPMTCMCDECCTCQPSFYIQAKEIVE